MVGRWHSEMLHIIVFLYWTVLSAHELLWIVQCIFNERSYYLMKCIASIHGSGVGFHKRPESSLRESDICPIKLNRILTLVFISQYLVIIINDLRLHCTPVALSSLAIFCVAV